MLVSVAKDSSVCGCFYCYMYCILSNFSYCVEDKEGTTRFQFFEEAA